MLWLIYVSYDKNKPDKILVKFLQLNALRFLLQGSENNLANDRKETRDARRGMKETRDVRRGMKHHQNITFIVALISDTARKTKISQFHTVFT